MFLNNIFITQNFVTKIVSVLYNSIWDSILKRTIKFYGIVNFCDFWNFSIISLRQKIFNVLFDNNCSYKICYKIGKSSLGTKRQILPNKIWCQLFQKWQSFLHFHSIIKVPIGGTDKHDFFYVDVYTFPLPTQCLFVWFARSLSSFMKGEQRLVFQKMTVSFAFQQHKKKTGRTHLNRKQKLPISFWRTESFLKLINRS